MMDRVTSSELFARWREDGDPRARDELVERSLPLARKLAGRYRGGASEPFDDLVQVASLGLVKAVDRFDPKRGTSFSSFAVPTILGELKRYFRDTGWSVHVTRGAQELALRVQEAERAVSERTGCSPTAKQLADYLGVGVEEVIDGLQIAASHHATSLDTPYDETDERSRPLVEMLGDDDEHYELIVEHETIATAATHLSQRDQAVLALRVGEDLTQTQIAQRIGVSQMQVSRILSRTLEQIRAATADTDQTLQLLSQREGDPTSGMPLDAPNPHVNGSTQAAPGARGCDRVEVGPSTPHFERSRRPSTRPRTAAGFRATLRAAAAPGSRSSASSAICSNRMSS